MEDFDIFISDNFKMKKNFKKFQGNLKKNTYFEGYYYKITKENYVLSIIVGVSLNKDSHAFIQILQNSQNPLYYRFDISEFYYGKKKYFLRIKDNYFSSEALNISLDNIKLALTFKEVIPCKNSIMGIFNYVPFMKCRHQVISYYSEVDGQGIIDDKNISFNKDILYLEKDYGKSFPNSYFWVEGLSSKRNAHLFLAVAAIPYFKCEFTGIISTLIINGSTYNISSYNKARLLKKTDKEIIIENKKYKLEVIILKNETSKLIAPTNGQMSRTINESNNGEIMVKMADKNGVFFHEIFNNCGIEIER